MYLPNREMRLEESDQPYAVVMVTITYTIYVLVAMD